MLVRRATEPSDEQPATINDCATFQPHHEAWFATITGRERRVLLSPLPSRLFSDASIIGRFSPADTLFSTSYASLIRDRSTARSKRFHSTGNLLINNQEHRTINFLALFFVRLNDTVYNIHCFLPSCVA